ncbi:MAG: winged helix DNA-binding domain-containing protein [Bacteroidota bacterium]
MKPADIRSRRLLNQQLISSRFTTPAELVHWMAAMQAQEYAMSKWAIGLRLPGSTDADIEEAFNNGHILRTHLMRPTWHFVAPQDIRWLLQLTAPRVHQFNGFMYRKCGMDKKIFKRANDIFIKMLEGGTHLTRDTLNEGLKKKKIITDGVGLSCIMMQAELDGIVCGGPRQGKQFTYALLEERVPAVKPFSREEALAALTSQYFKSRGPATLQDYATWCGLTITDAKKGMAMLGKEFEHYLMDGKEYVFSPMATPPEKKTQASFLMPDYDEYGMGYKDRSAIIDPDNTPKQMSRDNPIFNRMIIIDGQIAGTWQRVVKGKTVMVETFPFSPLNKTQSKELEKAVKRFLEFTLGDKSK